MKATVVILLLMALAPALATGGEIFGNIMEGGHPVGAGLTLVITVENRPPQTTQTDEFGSYRIFLPEQGQCTIVVRYQQQTPSVQVYSFDKSFRYNLVLERAQDGRYSLRRK
jgi:hypothetical protein